MPTNLPADYYKIEDMYREATTPEEKIRYLEDMMSVVPKHKGTDHLRADLRKKLSKLRDTSTSSKGTARQVSPYHINREGAGQVVVIGPPNVGKSSLVAALTNADPEVATYPFTTRMPSPGMMAIDNIQVQLIDTPPLTEDVYEPELYNLIRRSDLILLLVDLQGFPMEQMEQTLERLAEQRIYPDTIAEQDVEERRATWFKPVLVVVNKTDDEGNDEDFEVMCELLGEEVCPLVPVSVVNERNMDVFKQAVFDRLEIIRIYSQPPGREPNFDAPFVVKKGATVEDFAAKVHKDFVDSLKSARVWGEGVYEGQMVGRDHLLHDEDVVELKT